MCVWVVGALCATVSISMCDRAIAHEALLAQEALRSLSSSPPETITIHGRDHPERIPDHWLWRTVFLKLSEISRSGARGDLAHVLPLSAADAQVLYMEAGQQARRDDDCERAIVMRKDELKEQGVSKEVEARAIDDVTIACRVKDLDAAERVLDGISDDGRLLLQAWLDEQRRGITVFVPKHEIKVFRLPR
jgi:hypothetical protein